MSKKRITKREARRTARARRKVINRILTVGLLLLFAAGITWIVISSLEPKADLPPAPTSGGPTPELIGTKQYSQAPPFEIDIAKQYFATVKMAKGGEFVIELYPEKAPITVNSFVFLARQGYYDGVTFHRVLEGFMAQGGDPTGTGGGGPGYAFVNEVSDLKFDKAGVVAMANSGPDTNGSQFFIMFGPYGLSEDTYTIFGQVIEGMDVVNGITLRDPNTYPDYTGDVIESISIREE